MTVKSFSTPRAIIPPPQFAKAINDFIQNIGLDLSKEVLQSTARFSNSVPAISSASFMNLEQLLSVYLSILVKKLVNTCQKVSKA